MGLGIYAAQPGSGPTDNEGEDYIYSDVGVHTSWSYSGFNRFRERLAIHEGFFLDNMAGFTVEGEPWSDVTTDLVPLLNHSDCDGEMTWQEAAQVWPRLEQILEEWSDPENLFDYDLRAGRNLVEVLKYCDENQTTVLFR